MRLLLKSLPYDIVIVSGASVEQIRTQVHDAAEYLMGQNGNHVVHGDEELWRDELTDEEVALIQEHIASLPRDWDVPDENDLVEVRGSQVSYSIFGHHAPVSEKEAFDPEQNKRRALLAAVPLESETIEVKIAGTTTLDYFKKGRNKGYNVTRLIEHEGWSKGDCLYFGDALYPGGNDETVLGVIETRAVENEHETYTILTEMV